MTGAPARAHVLAGDVGGTKTNLAVYAVDAGQGRRVVREASFPSRRYTALETVLAEFMAAGGETIGAAAFGIAGPVIDDAVVTTNLPWRVEARALSAHMGGVKVRLMNDLEATAYGALFLAPEDLVTLNPGTPRTGNRAIIAAGTGLGQAFSTWDGTRYHPVATEGGHADFAPRDEVEMGLLAFLRPQYDHVSWERLLSGPGLVNIYRFFTESLARPVSPALATAMAGGDPAAAIGAAAVGGTSPTAVEAVDLFIRLYGAQAGNLALTTMAVGGIYVGGGIAPKLLPRLTAAGAFVSGFTTKGRYASLMSQIPVWVILDPKTARLGAAVAAIALLP